MGSRRVVGAVAVGLVATAVVVASPDVPLVVRGPALQAVVETSGGIATLAAALVVHGRFRGRPTLPTGLLLAALLTFGLANLLLAAVPAAFESVADSYDTWGALGTRFVATLAFAAAALVTRPVRVPLAGPLAGAVAVIATAVTVCAVAGPHLPPAVDLPANITQVEQLQAHPVVVAANVVGLVAFLTAAVGFSRRRGDDFLQDLAAASVVGAFSRLHLALVPSLYTGAVYSGDLFRLGFHGLVLLAALAEISRSWRDREALAVSEERRRVARELHDGMAQELAFISSTSSRLVAAGRGGQVDVDVQLIASAARRALDESRRAIAALTRPLDEPLPAALAEALDEVARRTGGTVDLDLDPRASVPAAQREELLRITREAVGNSLRHAGTGEVAVTLVAGPPLVITVADRGRGFDVDVIDNPHGFGLISMRERAAALGATFELVSSPERGTAVTVTLSTPSRV